MWVELFDVSVKPPERDVPLEDYISKQILAASDPLTAKKWNCMLDLAQALHAHGPHPVVRGTSFPRGELLLLAKDKQIKIWVDHYDYGPLIDGFPQLHFRIEVHGKEALALREAHRETVAEVAHIILDEFGLIP